MKCKKKRLCTLKSLVMQHMPRLHFCTPELILVLLMCTLLTSDIISYMLELFIFFGLVVETIMLKLICALCYVL